MYLSQKILWKKVHCVFSRNIYFHVFWQLSNNTALYKLGHTYPVNFFTTSFKLFFLTKGRIIGIFFFLHEDLILLNLLSKFQFFVVGVLKKVPNCQSIPRVKKADAAGPEERGSSWCIKNSCQHFDTAFFWGICYHWIGNCFKLTGRQNVVLNV